MRNALDGTSDQISEKTVFRSVEGAFGRHLGAPKNEKRGLRDELKMVVVMFGRSLLRKRP